MPPRRTRMPSRDEDHGSLAAHAAYAHLHELRSTSPEARTPQYSSSNRQAVYGPGLPVLLPAVEPREEDSALMVTEAASPVKRTEPHERTLVTMARAQPRR